MTTAPAHRWSAITNIQDESSKIRLAAIKKLEISNAEVSASMERVFYMKLSNTQATVQIAQFIVVYTKSVEVQLQNRLFNRTRKQ